MPYYFVYILTNTHNTVLYTGVTNDLHRRLWEHKNHTNPDSFTARYNVHKLAYYEVHESPESAIEREKQIKKGSRAKKVRLIEGMNPEWKDLLEGLDVY